MPTIPSLERRTVTPSSRVSNVAVADISSVGRELTGAITRVTDKRDQYELADAKTKFSILSHQQNNAYDQDDEYETIPQRWDENMSKGVDEIAAKISNPEARNFFMMEARERVEASRPRISQVAFSKERDVKRADMNTTLNGLREIVLGKDEEAARIAIEDAKNLYSAAAERGYVDHEEGVKTIQAWKQDAAVGRIRMLAPEDRAKVLKDPLVTANIQSDQLAELQRETDDAVLDQQADGIVSNLGFGFSRMQAYKVSSKIKDTKLKKKVEGRIKDVLGQQQAAEREQMEDYHQKWFAPTVLGEKELNTKDPEFMALDADLQASLIKVNQTRNTPKEHTNPALYETLITLERNKDWKTLRETVNKAIEDNQMSSSDIAKYMRISIEGDIPEEWESKFSLDQQIAGKLSQFGDHFTADDKIRVRGFVNDWHRDQVENGNIVTDEQLTKKIKEFTTEVDLNPNRFRIPFTKGTESFAKLDYEDRVKLINNTLTDVKKVSDNQFGLVISQISMGNGPSEDEDGNSIDTKAIEVGAKNYQRLNDESQKSLVGFVRKVDSKAANLVQQELIKELGKKPSAEQFLERVKEKFDNAE